MQSTAAAKRVYLSFQFLVTGLLAFPAAADLPGTTASAASRIARISVPFVANQGQIDSRVAYYARTFAGTVFVTTEGRLVYSLARGRNPSGALTAGTVEVPAGWTLSESFASEPATPVGLQPAAARISDFAGRAGAARSNQPTYEGIGLGEVAPGISLELRAAGSNVEKLFQVNPGADVRRIRVRIEGAERLSLADDGSLTVGTGLGDLQFTAPVAYQERGGSRIIVPARYILASGGEYGFAVSTYDRTLPLTIDPLIRSTFSGGNGVDVIRAMLIHPGSGDVYVAGSTTSTNFPGPLGAQMTLTSGTDAFVARYSAGLTSLMRASYYGGGGLDVASAIAILPSSGDIYIAGTTSSTSLFGIPSGNGFSGGATDAFIARFDGALDSLLGAIFFGGNGDDAASSLAVDNIAGEIIVAGDTTSNNLPLGTGAQQSGNNGGQDAFAARFSAGLSPIRATYFGGSSADRALAVAIDPLTSDVVLAGLTASSNLPGTANGALPSWGGANDGFVARFDGGLTTLRQSTYFGGSNSDQINAVAIHPINGQIYVAGDTTSADLRGKLSGQISPGGNGDAFVARFNRELSGLLAVSYFGGTGLDFGNALAISRFTGEIYVAGSSASASLPGTSVGIQEGNLGGNDAYVARFDAGLVGVKQTTFLGGNGSDIAYAVALTDTVAYIAGETTSFPPSPPPAFPGVASSAQPVAGGGGSDGFISALGADLRLGNSTPAAFSFSAIVSALPLSVQVSAPAKVTPTGDALAYVDGQPGSTWCASSAANCSCDRTGSSFISGSAILTTTAPNPYYVCVRHTASAAPNVVTESTLHIGATAATFRVGTGSIPGFGCTLDVDGNGAQDALTDGLLIIRALFGLTGTAVTTGAIGPNAVRTGWSDINNYLNTNCGASFAP